MGRCCLILLLPHILPCNRAVHGGKFLFQDRNFGGQSHSKFSRFKSFFQNKFPHGTLFDSGKKNSSLKIFSFHIPIFQLGLKIQIWKENSVLLLCCFRGNLQLSKISLFKLPCIFYYYAKLQESDENKWQYDKYITKAYYLLISYQNTWLSVTINERKIFACSVEEWKTLRPWVGTRARIEGGGNGGLVTLGLEISKNRSF